MINTTLRNLFSQRPADENPTSLRQLLDHTRECIGALHVHGIDTASWDSILVYIVSQLIPDPSLDLWEQHIPRNQLPTIEQLLTFLEDRFRVLEFSAARVTTAPRSRARPQTFHAASSSCRLCQGPQHPLRQCDTFLEMSQAQRLEYVIRAKLCKNCFAFSHKTQACRSSGTCSTCGEKHHSLLHLANASSHQQPPPSSLPAAPTLNNSDATAQPGQPQPTPRHSNAFVAQPENGSSDESVLSTAIVVVKAFDGNSHSFRALLDNGSQENFVSRRVVQFLGVKPHATSIAAWAKRRRLNRWVRSISNLVHVTSRSSQ